MAKVQMTEIPADVLRAAQERLGYSDRDMANRLHVGTERTWWRWRTQGRVPTRSLPAVAHVLQMPELMEGFVGPTGNGDADLSRLEGRVEDVRQRVDEVLKLLQQQQTGTGMSRRRGG